MDAAITPENPLLKEGRQGQADQVDHTEREQLKGAVVAHHSMLSLVRQFPSQSQLEGGLNLLGRQKRSRQSPSDPPVVVAQRGYSLERYRKE